MNHERRPLAIAGGAVILALVLAAVFLIRRGQDATGRPSRPSATTQADSLARAGAGAEAETSRAEARRARDAMRSDILEALRRRDAGGPPALASARPRPVAPASTPSPEDEPHGHYEPSYIREHFREDMFPLLKQCYASALERRPELGGRLVLKFGIVGDPQVGGIVEGAEFADESDLKDDEMETCVRESVMTLTFDKPPTGGGYVSVTYPVLFSPGDPPPEEGGAPAP
jgi:hypothetical protein